jgi:hypothetical protein
MTTLTQLLQIPEVYSNLVVYAKPIDGRLTHESEAEFFGFRDHVPAGWVRVADYQQLSGLALREDGSQLGCGLSTNAINVLIKFKNSVLD